jgi:hypothetical protein
VVTPWRFAASQSLRPRGPEVRALSHRRYFGLCGADAVTTRNGSERESELMAYDTTPIIIAVECLKWGTTKRIRSPMMREALQKAVKVGQALRAVSYRLAVEYEVVRELHAAPGWNSIYSAGVQECRTQTRGKEIAHEQVHHRVHLISSVGRWIFRARGSADWRRDGRRRGHALGSYDNYGSCYDYDGHDGNSQHHRRSLDCGLPSWSAE